MERSLTIYDKHGQRRRARLLTKEDFAAVGVLDADLGLEAKRLMYELLGRSLGCSAAQVAADFEGLTAALLVAQTSLKALGDLKGSIDDKLGVRND